MTLESNVSDLRVASAEPSVEFSSQKFWTDAEDEGDEHAFGKGPTLMIDLEEHSSAGPGTPAPEVSLKYIQGIVQGDRAYLVTNLLQDQSQTLLQPQMVWTIGRNRSAALPLQDRKLSRRHAVIMYAPEDGFYLVDLNSMNGSYWNGQRVQQRQKLQDGDRICLGTVRFSFFISVQERTVEPIHPEVLSRLVNSESRPASFIDFSELKEEISFNVHK
jgi:FHA domain